MAVIEGILVLRIWALYRTHKLVLFVVFFSYTACIATLVGLTISDYVAENVIIETELNFLPGCYAAGVPRLIAGYWIAPVVVESIFFALTISRTFAWIRNRESVPPTLGLLARDSLVYFAVVFVLLIANLLVFEYAPPTLSSLLVTPSNTAGCIAGSRMLLNLRNSFSRRPPQTADMELSLRPDLPEYHVARTPRKYGDPTLTYSERSDYTFGSGKDSVKGRLSGVEEA
ncbi:hypothetical protein PLICRDRAFT_176401 [Plicaturopsis crispa FD-325 SS-3]|nr:hypothetical protein PLICRDRAFT_176401 [Plicaturopsis crispa FD-325 SS-3]